MNHQKFPFITLGNHLKYVREQSKQSLSEVSGAVEIDEEQLKRIEAGIERPSEDILMLLISHFGVQDREAVQLWELARYDNGLSSVIDSEGQVVQANGKTLVMVLTSDARSAVYSDGVEVTANKAGVTVSFTQQNGAGQASPLSRIGMSHQQAEEVIRSLQQAMLRAKYLSGTKLLPPKL